MASTTAQDTTTPLAASLLLAALALPGVQPVRAESAPEQGLVAFKLLDYRESQPGESRIRVRAPSLMVMTPLGADWSVTGTLNSDAISGASPAYHTSGLTRMHDDRHALDLAATRYFAHGSLTLGVNGSKESDYLSRGLSALGTLSSEDRNTTWTFGLGANSDAIDPTNHAVTNEHKRVTEVLAGVTQVLGMRDIALLNLGYSRGRGYFSDPYKVFDKRPREHDRRTLLARWNHHLDTGDATLRLSYRYYADSDAVHAHTLGLEYVQPLGQGWAVTPLARLYSQSAARFYVDADTSGSPFPPNPPDGAVYYSEDQRLSAFGARTFGLKLAKQFASGWLADLKFEQYMQRAAWKLGGGGSEGLAPFRARSLQFGLSRPF